MALSIEKLNRQLLISGHKVRFSGSEGAYYWNDNGPFKTTTEAVQHAIGAYALKMKEQCYD